MRQNIIIAMLTFIIFVLLRREQRQPQVVASVPQQLRKDRTLEELSPTYARDIAENRLAATFPPEQVVHHYQQIVTEFMQHNLSNVERHLVEEYLGKLFYYGWTYEQNREALLDQRTEEWLDEIGEVNSETEE
jgi:hypothetical protein